MSLEDHLDSLFAVKRLVEDGSVDVSAWNTLIEEYEAGPTRARVDDEPSFRPEYFVTTPWPSILDNYPLAGPSQPHRPPSPSSVFPSPSPEQFAGSANVTALDARIRNHLPVPSSFDSLRNVLSSPRSNEDIQLELVEILGFEGAGLQLVEEILKPGNRAALVEGFYRHYSGPSGGTSNRHVNGHGYLPSARLNVTAKSRDKKQKIDITGMIGSNEDIERRIQEQLERPKAMFSEDGPRSIEEEVLPNVYTSSGKAPKAMSYGGRFALPEGTTRQMYDENFEEVVIPPSRPIPPKRTERPVRITDLPPLAKGCFPNYVTLNRMQSIVQPTAMNTNENMLICAPTGAGKTDVAIMSIIRVLSQYVQPGPSTHPSGFNVNRDAFKIIYVAPMKALAAEITRKFGKRLAWLGIKVRELTGDMQLTRQEINETQIIVTTPEKWDVVTRKPTGEGELASKVRLLIIDEVHLLNEERGAVIETIVARTLRQVESSQSLIRIVGLSATLPNYRDVSDFLRVNPYQGLFFFDASFRPVPLEQHFIGVAGKPRSQASIRNMDQTVFDKVSELVQDGHQVMVFVHARKETVKSAQRLLDMAKEEGIASFFENKEHPNYSLYRRDISTSRNKEMKELFDAGFGIHHAGMLRSDRNMMERMFEDNAIKVLCCTSTLAWGVNLPAHAVVIKGTQVYDSGKGSFVDLSVLDVLQIFGRAGRPGYETSGVGYICTTQDKLEHYLYSIMAQHPIESKFIPGMVDSLNAEISLGTIANVQDAIQWLGYTYLFVRMRREPFIYGMPHDEPRDDPQLGNKRNELIVQSARQLALAKMIRFDEIANAFQISDLGRIAAKYYLRYQTMEVFNTMFNPHMKNADLFAMLSQATEFEQIQIRENEVPELTAILESDHCPMEVKGGVSSKHGKVNILLQAHISKVYLEDFALVSDAAYVAQNAARIIRALLEIALSRHWANNTMLLIDLSKAIEQRLWPYEHPLAQINSLQRETLHNLRQWADETEIRDLREMNAKEIGELVHLNERHGQAIHDVASAFPLLKVDYTLRPLSHDLLEIAVHVEPQFNWDSKISGGGEPFYIWIQDEEGTNILQWRSILLRPNSASFDIDFTIPVAETIPGSYSIVSVSDRWLGSDDVRVISLGDLVMPDQCEDSTQLLDIPYLHVSCLDDRSLVQSYQRFITSLNSMQSQAFWAGYHTQNNMLLSAPVASGKSFIGEVAIWHAYRHDPEAVVLILVPQRRSVEETAARLRSIVPKDKRIDIRTSTSPSALIGLSTLARTISITTPALLSQIDDPQITTTLRRVSLFILEDLHLLDEFYELSIARILSIAKPIKTRIVGLTSSLNDPTDLAAWLLVDPAWRFAFYPRDRGSPIVVSVKTYTLPHSATLLKAMVKPAYDIVKAASDGTIIFVPSRSVCKTVAKDLVTQSGNEMDLNGFLTASREDVEPLLIRLKDEGLYEPILHGIGYIIPGSPPADQALVLELFASGILRTLIAPRESCWNLPVRASTVVLMGAQYVQMVGDDRSERRVVPYSRTELVKMQGYAVSSASHLASGGRMYVMCQAEQGMTISRVLSDGLPLESNLPALLRRESSAPSIAALGRMIKYRQPPPPPQIDRRRIPDLRKRDVMDLIGWTYFGKRVVSNPTYYNAPRAGMAEAISRLVDEWFRKGIDEFGPVPSALSSSGSGSRGGSRSITASGASPRESISTTLAGESVISGPENGAPGEERDTTGAVDTWAGGAVDGSAGGWGVAAPPEGDATQ